MKTIPDPCSQRARLAPDAVAFQSVENGRIWRFADVERRVARAAHWLRDQHLTAGDRIAILCQNNPVFFELLFACARTGVILVPLNWRQTVAELGPILADCGARLLVHDAANAALAGAIADGHACVRVSLDDVDALVDEPGPSIAATCWPTDRIWYLLYTSGTTGTPKAVIQNAGMALANAVNVQQATGIDATTQALNFLPLFHTAGINLHTLPVFLMGGMSRFIAKFDPEIVLDLIDSGVLTVFFGVPQVYQALGLSPRFPAAKLDGVRHWGCGGAPISASLLTRFLARGVPICNGMGMTETGPTVFLMDPARAADKIGSVGKPQLLAEVRIADAEGTDVGPGQEGELLFRGPGITPGYFGNPAATAAAFTPDGWLRSGDVGHRDAEGYYYIVDRIKDMYISGGENVYPAEVERVLGALPGILDIAVFGVPDARWGEVGHAAILPHPGATLDLAEIRRLAREKLAAYKVPHYFTLVEAFPRTAAGKIQKQLLRRQLAGEGS